MFGFVMIVVTVLVLAAVTGVLFFRTKPGAVRKFLGVAAVSAAAFPVCVVLHNAVDALFHFEEAVFFLVAVIGAPLGMLVGVVGAAVAALMQRSKSQAGV